jgi:hypothetical protein
MSDFSIGLGIVREVENIYSKNPSNDKYERPCPADGLRIRAELPNDNKKGNTESLPWIFPLLPKVFQSIPKVGEVVFVFTSNKERDQRYYLGPIISQPQYFTKCEGENAKTLIKGGQRNPLATISNSDDTRGAFPKSDDIAVIGRGSEDVILRYDDTTKASEIQLRAGVRGEPVNSSNQNIVGNIIFNGTDPAYIQLKYKNGIAKNENNEASSIINLVANRINIMSNKDTSIAHNLGDKDSMISDEKMDEIMDKLHPVPMGDKLVDLLKIIKGSILYHVHPWAGMEQCGDWENYVSELKKFDLDSINSDYVKIS